MIENFALASSPYPDDSDRLERNYIAPIFMVVTGDSLLANGGLITTKREHTIDVGPLKGQADVKEHHPVLPAVEWANFTRH